MWLELPQSKYLLVPFCSFFFFFLFYFILFEGEAFQMGAEQPLSLDLLYVSMLPPYFPLSAGREEAIGFVSQMARRPGTWHV